MNKMLLKIMLVISACLHSTDMTDHVNIPDKTQNTIALKSKFCKQDWGMELPVTDSGDPLEVNVGMSLRSIDLNEAEEVIETRIEISMIWKNDLFAWDADEYGGREVILCKTNEVWVPDVSMRNNADSRDKHSNYLRNNDNGVRISNFGLVELRGLYMFKASCDLNLEYFPYDSQTCILPFSSWEHDMNALKLFNVPGHQVLANEHNISSDYQTNGAWELLRRSISIEFVNYDCCQNNFTELQLKLELKRRSRAPTLNIVLPCMILSCLSLIVFLLPEESGEKIGLCITILLALTVFQQLTADSLPKSGVPYITKFYLIVMLSNAIALVVSTMTLSFYHSSNQPPRWLHVAMVDYIGKVLCVRSKKKRAAVSPLTETVGDVELVDVDAVAEEKAAARDPTSGGTVSFNNDEDDDGRSWLNINRVLNRLFFVLCFLGIFIAFIFLFVKDD